METMKKLFIYFLLFIGAFIFVEIGTNFNMKQHYRDLSNYSVNVESPKITVEESKATYSHGYINGKIENDTGEHIRNKYLQFDFYDKDGLYVGTKEQKINYFNVGEKIKFEIEYDYVNVDSVKISFVDTVNKPEVKTLDFFGFDFDNENDDDLKKIGITLGLLFGVYALLP